MPEVAVQISNHISIYQFEIEFSFARSGGPGGQNVNKVNSKAILKWHVASSANVPAAVKQRFQQQFYNQINNDGFLVLQSDAYRDQPRNMQDCLDKLANMLREVERPPKKRRATKPSRAQKEARLQQKRQIAEKKQNRKKIDY